MTPAQRLQALISVAREELVLCAPFVKRATLERLLETVTGSPALTLITRWRPEEIAAGVSDPEVFEVVASHRGKILLHDRLHAKYFRSESLVLLGSANLTATALGWSPVSNLELLVEAEMHSIVQLERTLLEEAVMATASLALQVRSLADQLTPPARLPAPGDDEPEVPMPTWSAWLPTLRHPSDLYRAYEEGGEALTARSGANARVDIAWLDLPTGLDEQRFRLLVGNRLLQHPTIRELDELLAEGQRFGAVRDFVASHWDLDTASAGVAWQTLMRWLLEFLPDRYTVRTPNWSEVIQRTQP